MWMLIISSAPAAAAYAWSLSNSGDDRSLIRAVIDRRFYLLQQGAGFAVFKQQRDYEELPARSSMHQMHF